MWHFSDPQKALLALFVFIYFLMLFFFTLFPLDWICLLLAQSCRLQPPATLFVGSAQLSDPCSFLMVFYTCSLALKAQPISPRAFSRTSQFAIFLNFFFPCNPFEEHIKLAQNVWFVARLQKSSNHPLQAHTVEIFPSLFNVTTLQYIIFPC